MNRNALIAVALVGVVGVALVLSRKPVARVSSDSGASSLASAFKSVGGASVTDPMGQPDPHNVPLSSGSSAGPSALITPDDRRLRVPTRRERGTAIPQHLL